MTDLNCFSDALLALDKKSPDHTCQNAFRSRPLRHNFNILMKRGDILPTVNNITRNEVSWSIYKQMINMLQPKKLSCMAAVYEGVSTDSLKTKAKIKEMQELESDIQTFIANESPIDRIKRTFSFNVKTGTFTEQRQRFDTVVHACFGLFFCFGGFKGFFEGRKEFFESNKMTMFATKSTYHKTRARYQMKCLLKEGISLSLKGGLFCMSSFFFYQCIEIYMNKTTPWSFAVAFGATGSLGKISLGPKGMFSGFVIGAAFGTIAGLACYGVLKASGHTQEELNFMEVKALVMAKRKFEKQKATAVTEYHEEVDDIE